MNDNEGKLLNSLNSLRFLFALEIIIGHVVQMDTVCFGLRLFQRFLIVSVCFFFFISAFGMSYKYKKQGLTYLKAFIKRKCGYLSSITVVMYAVGCLVDNIVEYNLNYLPVTNFFTTVNWYIFELMILYILFYCAFKWVKNDKIRIISILVVSIIIMTVTSFLNFIDSWGNSILSFTVGLIFGCFYDKVCKVLMSSKGIFIIFFLILVGFSTFKVKNSYMIMYTRNCIGIAFILLLCVIFIHMNCQFSCRWFYTLSKFSTEMYLYQFIWLEYASYLNTPLVNKFIFVLIYTLGCTFLIHPLNLYIKKYFRRLFEKD